MNHPVMRESAIADELQQALESLDRAMRANPRPVEPEKERQRGKIIQFPLWPEPKRGMPNPTLRFALQRYQNSHRNEAPRSDLNQLNR
jgi:hypothetical protein